MYVDCCNRLLYVVLPSVEKFYSFMFSLLINAAILLLNCLVLILCLYIHSGSLTCCFLAHIYITSTVHLIVSWSINWFTSSMSHGIQCYFPGLWGTYISDAILLYPRREAGILWIHHRSRPQRFLVSDLQSTFLSGFLSYLAGGLLW